MALWIKIGLVSFGVVVIGIAVAYRIGSARWNQTTTRSVERLTGSVPQGKTTRVAFAELTGLPAPVAKYFRRVLTDGQPMIRSARMIHEGGFRSRAGDDKWSSMKATEHFSADPPGFVWDADIGMAPLVKVQVRDAYLDGQGSMQAKVYSLVPVVDARDRVELNAGALQRYLAEAAWIPTALLPSANLQWGPIDDTSALATLTDRGTTVSLEFRFNDVGEITSVFTPGRYREVAGKYEPTPWCGHWRKYEERDGMRIPMEGEVEWQLPEGSLPYWRGRVVHVEYDFES